MFLSCPTPPGALPLAIACCTFGAERGRLFPSQIRHLARGDLRFPVVQQWPADGAGAKVGHVLVLSQPVDGFLEGAAILAEGRAVAWQQHLGVILADALKGTNEIG